MPSLTCGCRGDRYCTEHWLEMQERERRKAFYLMHRDDQANIWRGLRIVFAWVLIVWGVVYLTFYAPRYAKERYAKQAHATQPKASR